MNTQVYTVLDPYLKPHAFIYVLNVCVAKSYQYEALFYVTPFPFFPPFLLCLPPKLYM